MIDVEAAGNAALLFICKAFRMMQEDQFRIPLWYEMVKRGVHPGLALCVCQCVRPTLKDYGWATHNTCAVPPKNVEQLKCWFADTVYHRDSWEAISCIYGRKIAAWSPHLLPISPNGRLIKVPDGWGGYTKKEEPQTLDALTEDLLKLQKEYVKNG